MNAIFQGVGDAIADSLDELQSTWQKGWTSAINIPLTATNCDILPFHFTYSLGNPMPEPLAVNGLVSLTF